MATPAQLAQQALNIVVPLQQHVNDGRVSERQAISDLCAAVIALCQATLGTSPSLTQVSTKYSAAASTTAPLITKGP